LEILVEADFLADLRGIVLGRLAAEGYTADPSLTTEAMLWNLLKIQHRRIDRRKRRVEWSIQLRRRQDSLLEDIVVALGRIVIAAESGDDLNPFLSRDLASNKAFKREDMMLNELGVHHLHLGAGVNGRGLVSGRDELLFAFVTDEAIHLIEVFDHKSFGDEEAFRTAQGNWPQLFEGRKAQIAPSRDPQAITPEQRKVLRSKHANVLVAATDGTLFFPPGGGMMSNGMSPSVLTQADRILGRLQEHERWCKENGTLLAERFEADSGRRATAFRLRFDGFEEAGAIIVIDEDNQVRFRFE
jgi:hypothetical protein